MDPAGATKKGIQGLKDVPHVGGEPPNVPLGSEKFDGTRTVRPPVKPGIGVWALTRVVPIALLVMFLGGAIDSKLVCCTISPHLM